MSALQAALALVPHISLERQGLLRICRDLAGGEQPVQLMFFDWRRQPAEKEMRSARERNLAERDSKRKLEERGGVGCAMIRACKLEECALDFAAAFGQVLSYDEQARIRVGGKMAFAPESTGDELGLSVGGLVKADLAGWLAGSGFLPRACGAPGVEEAALDGQNAVKAGEKERRAPGLGGRWRLIFKERNQFQRQARRAEQVAGAAGFVKDREPGAEVLRILLPPGAGTSCRNCGA